MKDGATKVVQTEEIPSSTKEHFNMVSAAILQNIGNFALLAIEAGYRPAIVELGVNINRMLNNALDAFDGQENQIEN